MRDPKKLHEVGPFLKSALKYCIVSCIGLLFERTFEVVHVVVACAVCN